MTTDVNRGYILSPYHLKKCGLSAQSTGTLSRIDGNILLLLETAIRANLLALVDVPSVSTSEHGRVRIGGLTQSEAETLAEAAGFAK